MTNDPSEPDERQPNWLQRALANPYVSAAAWIATIISIPLAILLYVRGAKERELVWYVNPAQAVVVNSHTASSLHVFHDNSEITSDVTAAQVSIWNAGNESIRPENVLEKIQIVTVPRRPILEVRVRRTSRTLVEVGLNDSQLAQGVVGASWNILEHNDGAEIQVVYAGPPTTQLRVEGTIEGQHSLRTGNSPADDTLTKLNFGHYDRADRIATIVTPIFALAVSLLAFSMSRTSRARRLGVELRIPSIAMLVLGIASGIYSLYALKNAPIEPPAFNVSHDNFPAPSHLISTPAP